MFSLNMMVFIGFAPVVDGLNIEDIYSIVKDNLGLTDVFFRAIDCDMNQEQWKQIEKAASQLGVGEWALKKWKQRGIPFKWHVPLSDKTGIKLRDMFADRMARND